MTIVRPRLVFALYSVIFVLPACRIHGLKKLVGKPVLMVASVSPFSALLRCAAMFLAAWGLGFPNPDTHWQNPRHVVLDKLIWNDTMWSMITWGERAQAAAFVLYASCAALQSCHEFDEASQRGRGRAGRGGNFGHPRACDGPASDARRRPNTGA
jgi:hypothetical protein